MPMPHRSSTFAPLFLSAAALLWAGNFAVGRAIRESLEPFEINFLRWAIAGLAILPVVIADRVVIRAEMRRAWGEIVVLSLGGVVALNTLIYASLKGAPAGTSGIVIATSPLLVLLVSFAWGARKPSFGQAAGLALSCAGVAILLSGGSEPGPDADNYMAGILYALAAAFVLAIYTVLLARLQTPLRPVTLLSTTIWIGLALMLPVAWTRMQHLAQVSWTPEVVMALLYLGLAASLLAFLFWMSGVAVYGARKAAGFIHLIPVFSVCLSGFLLGEPPKPREWTAMVPIAVGLFLAGVIPLPSFRRRGPARPRHDLSSFRPSNPAHRLVCRRQVLSRTGGSSRDSDPAELPKKVSPPSRS
jgi:drug/metabolite transporter (DMT)-like permease